MKLKAELKDIPILSGYLHDSKFTRSDFQFKPDQNQFEIVIERIGYEKPEKGKFLFFITCFHYPSITSKLVITAIEKMELEWLDDAFNEPNDGHQLHDIEIGKNQTIEIYSDYLKIVLTHSDQVGLELEDISEPTKETYVTDFLVPVFQELEELEKLRQ